MSVNKALVIASIFTAPLLLAPPAIAADVGVSVSIGQPGFYGRLDIGGFPQPQVIYSQPVLVEQVPVMRPPIYLRVPPGHAKHWSKHCREYHACGERVYFVQDSWYQQQYVPRYEERHHERHDDRWEGRRDEHRGDRGEHGGGHGDRHDHDR